MSTTLLDQLRASISRLSLPAASQIEYLRKIKTYPSADELALEFHDLAHSKSRLQTQCAISGEALCLVAALDEKLNSFSSESHIDDWDASGLEDSRDWEEVRSIAKQLLEVLG